MGAAQPRSERVDEPRDVLALIGEPLRGRHRVAGSRSSTASASAQPTASDVSAIIASRSST